MDGDFRRDGVKLGEGVRPPLRTHSFGWDPSEQVRLAFRSAADRFRPSSPRRLLISAAAGAVAIGALAGATALVGRGEGATAAGAESALDKREAELRRREEAVAALERRQAATRDEIRDSEARIAQLQARRAELERQVAELTAPVAPNASDGELSDAGSPPREDVMAGEDDQAGETGEAVPQRAGADAPSSAAIDGVTTTADVDGPGAQAVSVDSGETPVRAELSANAQLRVFIHVRSADRAARERAEAVAAELRRRGVALTVIRGVPRPIRRDAVRYFYDADRELVSTLQDAVRQASSHGGSPAQPQDFRGYRAPPRQGTLELWLS